MGGKGGMIPGPGPSVSRHSERHCNVYNTRSHSTTVAEGGGPGGGVSSEGYRRRRRRKRRRAGGSEIDFTR